MKCVSHMSTIARDQVSTWLTKFYFIDTKNMFINIAANDLFASLSHLILSLMDCSFCMDVKDMPHVSMMIWSDEIASAF